MDLHEVLMVVLATSRSMALLRKREGLVVEKVEQWVPAPWLAGGGARSGAGIRRDLLGFVDLFVLDEIDRAFGVQCCAMSGRAVHVEKIRQLERDDRRVSRWLNAGLGLELHAWRKRKLFRGSKAVRWECEVWVVRRSEGGLEFAPQQEGSTSAL